MISATEKYTTVNTAHIQQLLFCHDINERVMIKLVFSAFRTFCKKQSAFYEIKKELSQRHSH